MRADNAKAKQVDRRHLLKGAGLAAGAAVTTAAIADKEAAAAGTELKPQSARYRETKDVKAYYRSARY